MMSDPIEILACDNQEMDRQREVIHQAVKRLLTNDKINDKKIDIDQIISRVIQEQLELQGEAYKANSLGHPSTNAIRSQHYEEEDKTDAILVKERSMGYTSLENKQAVKEGEACDTRVKGDRESPRLRRRTSVSLEEVEFDMDMDMLLSPSRSQRLSTNVMDPLHTTPRKMNENPSSSSKMEEQEAQTTPRSVMALSLQDSLKRQPVESPSQESIDVSPTDSKTRRRSRLDGSLAARQHRHHQRSGDSGNKARSKELPARRHTTGNGPPESSDDNAGKNLPLRRCLTTDNDYYSPIPSGSSRRASYASNGADELLKKVKNVLDASLHSQKTTSSSTFGVHGSVAPTSSSIGGGVIDDILFVPPSPSPKYNLLGSKIYQKAGDALAASRPSSSLAASRRNLSFERLPTLSTSLSNINDISSLLSTQGRRSTTDLNQMGCSYDDNHTKDKDKTVRTGSRRFALDVFEVADEIGVTQRKHDPEECTGEEHTSSPCAKEASRSRSRQRQERSKSRDESLDKTNRDRSLSKEGRDRSLSKKRRGHKKERSRSRGRRSSANKNSTRYGKSMDEENLPLMMEDSSSKSKRGESVRRARSRSTGAVERIRARNKTRRERESHDNNTKQRSRSKGAKTRPGHRGNSTGGQRLRRSTTSMMNDRSSGSNTKINSGLSVRRQRRESYLCLTDSDSQEDMGKSQSTLSTRSSVDDSVFHEFPWDSLIDQTAASGRSSRKSKTTPLPKNSESRRQHRQILDEAFLDMPLPKSSVSRRQHRQILDEAFLDPSSDDCWQQNRLLMNATFDDAMLSFK